MNDNQPLSPQQLRLVALTAQVLKMSEAFQAAMTIINEIVEESGDER